MKVRELMTSPVVTAAPETSLRDVATLLAEHQISGVPVVDRYGRVVGVVAESDIVRKEAEPCDGRTAADAMTSPPILVEGWMSDRYAAWLMTEHDINRLPVIDRGRLAGIVARDDLVREFARSDLEIAADVRERVLAALDALDVAVGVEQGYVHLTGERDSEYDVHELIAAAARIPGVVGVQSKIRVRRLVRA